MIKRLTHIFVENFQGMSRVSIKDIAREVGVSAASVSLVLNEKDEGSRISKDLAKKIREKAKEMHYEPNNLARSLRTGYSNTIGLIVADISNVFFASLAFHIQEQAEKYGYSVIIANTNESTLKMEKMINVLKSKPVDGFIIVPTEHGDSYICDLLKRHTPVVLIDRFFPHIEISSVIVDNYNSSRKACEYLINNGCRRVGLIAYKSELQHTKDRKQGYIDAMKTHGIYDPSLVKEIDYSTFADDIAITIDSLMSKENRVDGMFFATNTLSMAGIKQLFEAGIQVPRDLKVCCFDKSEAFDFMDAKIPYILQPIREMGKAAVELVIEQIKQDTNVETANYKSVVEIPARLITPSPGNVSFSPSS